MFKSLTIYQLTQATDAILKRLPAALESLPFAECTDHQVKSRGFVPPLGFGEITYSANGGTLFRLRTDVKELPAGAIKLMVQEQIAVPQQIARRFPERARRRPEDRIDSLRA